MRVGRRDGGAIGCGQPALVSHETSQRERDVRRLVGALRLPGAVTRGAETLRYRWALVLGQGEARRTESEMGDGASG